MNRAEMPQKLRDDNWKKQQVSDFHELARHYLFNFK
jgi:hypothetical protein